MKQNMIDLYVLWISSFTHNAGRCICGQYFLYSFSKTIMVCGNAYFFMIKKMQGSNKVSGFKFEKSVSRCASFLEVIESIEVSLTRVIVSNLHILW